MRAARRCDSLVVLGLLLAACGQKGPPLAPLHLVPAQATELSARRIDDQVRLRFVLPSTNVNGPGPVHLDRVEIYAMTVAPGVTPPNRTVLARENVVGRIDVRPPLAEGEEPKPGDTRPEPGSVVSFDEALTPEKLEPVVLKHAESSAPAKPSTAAKPPAGAAGAAPAELPGTPVPIAVLASFTASKDPVRVYIVRGLTRSGRTGQQSARVEVPLAALPEPPRDVSVRATETAVVLDWKPPPEAAGRLSFNVFRTDEPMEPLNAAPLETASFEYADAQFGQEYCFGVRSVISTPTARLEGGLSQPTCIAPTDVFPPAAPRKPDAVATPGQISLIWDANTEKDLAGYLVLRGPAPDGALEPLTPAPIRETSYRDTSVQPGVRYVYAIVAVDNAKPPNTSPQSPRVEETAR